MSNTVSLCMIVKNEKSNLPILLDQVCPLLEEVIIVDTGSSDGTLELIQEKQKIYSNIRLENFSWADDFSAARNFSFSLATKDWLFWLDGDDQVDPSALKRFKEFNLLESSVDVWVLDYIYSRFENGSPQTILGRERFLRRSIKPIWHGAIHESIPIWSYRSCNNYDLKIVHNRKGKVIDYGRNVRILESEYIKNQNDPRTTYYLGKELFDRVDPRGIEILERYLTLGGRYWDDEINARSRLAMHYLSVHNHGSAINIINPVYHLDNTRRRVEFYYVYGQTEYDLHNWELAIKWFKLCLVDTPPPPRVLNLEYFTWKPLQKIAEAYKRLGKISETFEYAKKVKEILTNGSADSWFEQVTSFDFGSGKKILEISDKKILRNSKNLFDMPGSDFLVSPDNFIIPFRDLDGVCIRNSFFEKSKNTSLLDSIFKKTKTKGFLILVLDSSYEISTKVFEDLGYSHLVDSILNQEKIRLFVKSDTSLEKISSLPGPYDFGPWRIRVCNLLRSAALAGHPVSFNVDKFKDIVIARHWSSNLPVDARIRVYDVCEKLDFYDEKCLSWSNVINVCSDELAKHMKKFTAKKIVVVEDSEEISEQEWVSLCV